MYLNKFKLIFHLQKNNNNNMQNFQNFTNNNSVRNSLRPMSNEQIFRNLSRLSPKKILQFSIDNEYEIGFRYLINNNLIDDISKHILQKYMFNEIDDNIFIPIEQRIINMIKESTIKNVSREIPLKNGNIVTIHEKIYKLNRLNLFTFGDNFSGKRIDNNVLSIENSFYKRMKILADTNIHEYIFEILINGILTKYFNFNIEKYFIIHYIS